MQDQGGAGQRKTLSLRGASPNAVLVLLDGVPLNGPGNAVDLSRLPVAMLERLEVMGGAGSRHHDPLEPRPELPPPELEPPPEFEPEPELRELLDEDLRRSASNDKSGSSRGTDRRSTRARPQ